MLQARERASAEAWAAVQRRLLRLAAFDTGALDGLYPSNPELTSRLVDAAIPEGQTAGTVTQGLAAFVTHQLRGYRMAEEMGAGGAAIDETFIRGLHAQMTGPQETFFTVTPRGEQVLPLPRGEYKQTLNFRDLPGGSVMPYAPVRLVPREMGRLVEQMGRREFAEAHPALQAAYAHLAITQIHPFADANGRVARGLASVFVSRATGLPLLVLQEQWSAYGLAQRRAEEGDRQALIDFMYARGVDAMDLATSLLSPLPAALRAKLESSEPVAVPPSVIAAAAARLVFDALGSELRERLVSPPAGIRLGISLGSPGQRSGRSPAASELRVSPGFKGVLDPETGNDAVILAIQSDRPPAHRIERRFVPVVSTTTGDIMPVGILEPTTGSHLELSLEDVDPLMTEMTRIRLRAWLSAIVAGAYSEI